MAARQITAAEVRDRLNRAIAAYGPGTQAAWAAANGLSKQYVNDVLKGRRTGGEKILAALGLKVTPSVVEVA